MWFHRCKSFGIETFSLTNFFISHVKSELFHMWNTLFICEMTRFKISCEMLVYGTCVSPVKRMIHAWKFISHMKCFYHLWNWNILTWNTILIREIAREIFVTLQYNLFSKSKEINNLWFLALTSCRLGSTQARTKSIFTCSRWNRSRKTWIGFLGWWENRENLAILTLYLTHYLHPSIIVDVRKITNFDLNFLAQSWSSTGSTKAQDSEKDVRLAKWTKIFWTSYVILHCLLSILFW